MPFPATPSYSLGYQSGVMAAGLAAAAPIYSFRWATVGQLCVVRSIRFSAGGITAFTAGAVFVDLITARAWSANDTGGGAVAWTNTASNRRRGTFADSGFATAGEIRASATAALSAGTRTLDTNPLSTVASSTTATAGDFIVPQTELLPQYNGAYPMVLSAAAAATAQGFVIRATVPATGTWSFAVAVHWEEYGEF